MILNYHVTNLTDKDCWFQSKRLLIIDTKIPEKKIWKFSTLIESSWWHVKTSKCSRDGFNWSWSQFSTGLYLTLRLRCFYCDSEDFGASWENLIQNRVCQDSVFQTCFINQTLPGKQATQVIDLVRSCRNNCACSDEGGWCSTLECRNYLKCCWERAYCDED